MFAIKCNIKSFIMEENQQEGVEQQKLSPEEIKARRTELVKDYREEIKFLKVQSEYEDLLATIEESKYRRYAAIAQTAQLFDHMEREEKAAKEFIAAQKQAAEQATEQETKETARKPRKLATQ
jgi:peptidoglycan hydrolase CwlO-like protein